MTKIVDIVLTKTFNEILEETGKPYGGKIKNCLFYTIKGHPLEGRTEFYLATGDLVDDPRNRFGLSGNNGMRTSYIIRRGIDWIETRNTVYQYESIQEDSLDYSQARN